MAAHRPAANINKLIFSAELNSSAFFNSNRQGAAASIGLMKMLTTSNCIEVCSFRQRKSQRQADRANSR